MGLMIGIAVIVNHPTYIRLRAKYFKKDDVSQFVQVTDFSTGEAEEVANFPKYPVQAHITAIKYTSKFEGIKIQSICMRGDKQKWLPSRINAMIANILKFKTENIEKAKALQFDFDEDKTIPSWTKEDVFAQKYELHSRKGLLYYPDGR